MGWFDRFTSGLNTAAEFPGQVLGEATGFLSDNLLDPVLGPVGDAIGGLRSAVRAPFHEQVMGEDGEPLMVRDKMGNPTETERTQSSPLGKALGGLSAGYQAGVSRSPTPPDMSWLQTDLQRPNFIDPMRYMNQIGGAGNLARSNWDDQRSLMMAGQGFY